MQKFDWDTFNATKDLASGPISQFVHDGSDILSGHDQEAERPLPIATRMASMAVLGIVSALIFVFDRLVF